MEVAVFKFFLFFFIVNQYVHCLFNSGMRVNLFSSNLDRQWNDYKNRFNKTYLSVIEDGIRRAIWEENLHRIIVHNNRFNKNLESYKMAPNHFTDWTRAELIRITGPDEVVTSSTTGGQQANQIPSSFPKANKTFPKQLHRKSPESIDLRGSSCLAGVKDQGRCGSCWAFAAVAPVEYRLCKNAKLNQAIILSEQQLVDCSWPYGNQGCNGGWETKAWDYIRDEGITTNCTYPYVAMDLPCRYRRSQAVATVPEYFEFEPLDISGMRAVIATEGPIVVILQVIDSFLHYSSGIYYDEKCLNLSPDTLNHAMAAVGYGTSKDGIPYWIVKNSWGIDWGIGGFALFRSGVNLCNIEMLPSYPNAEPLVNKVPADICF